MFSFCGEVKMPINNYQDYLSQISLQNAENFQSYVSSASIAKASLISRFFPTVPSIPSLSINLDNTSPYAINNQLNSLSTSDTLLLGGQFDYNGAGTLIVADLLNISGGLSGIVTTEQTINLPTAPLTRYTNGQGVFAGLIIWTAIGGTIVNASINYTNQDGVSEKISSLYSFPPSSSTSERNSGRTHLIPLAAGDTGVRAVKSVTLSASTGTAGNFGVILFKPLAMMSVSNQPVDSVSTGGFIGSLCKIFPVACLSGFLFPSTSTQTLSGSLFFGQ
jgi:hypothetical protein